MKHQIGPGAGLTQFAAFVPKNAEIITIKKKSGPIIYEQTLRNLSLTVIYYCRTKKVTSLTPYSSMYNRTRI